MEELIIFLEKEIKRIDCKRDLATQGDLYERYAYSRTLNFIYERRLNDD